MTTRTFTAVLIVICLLPTLIASAQPQFFLYDYDFSRNTAAIASHWEQVGLRDDNISSLAVPSNNGDIVYAGTDGFRHGVFYTPNRGSTWRAVNTGLGELDIRFLLLGNPSSDDVVYAFGKDTLWKTLDHGGHWTSVSLPWPEAHPACTFDVLSVSANRVLYASLWKHDHLCYWVGEWYSLVKSLDGGTSWSSVYPPMGPIIAIAVSPSNTSTVYASKGDKLIRTRDGGQSWLSLASVGKAYDVSSLIVHPTDSDTVYAVTERYGVYKSTDGGGSWMSLNQTLPNQGVDLQCPALAIHPMRPELVFLACNMYGIFYSMDAGLTWSLLGSGFNPFLRINSLAVAPISGQVSFHPTLRLVDQPYPYPEPYSVYLPLVMKAASPPFIVYVGTEAGVWRLVGP